VCCHYCAEGGSRQRGRQRGRGGSGDRREIKYVLQFDDEGFSDEWTSEGGIEGSKVVCGAAEGNGASVAGTHLEGDALCELVAFGEENGWSGLVAKGSLHADGLARFLGRSARLADSERRAKEVVDVELWIVLGSGCVWL
jgi:hypothetical protein